MKSSIANKSMLAVAVLLVAAFAGVAFVGTEDSDAAVSYTVSVDKADSDWDSSFLEKFGEGKDFTKNYRLTEISNKALGNDLKVVDGKVIGTVIKAPVDKTGKSFINEVWNDVDAKKNPYMFVININDLLSKTYVSYIASDGSVKSVQVPENKTMLSKTFYSDGSITSFQYVVSAENISAMESAKSVFDIAEKQVVEFDIEYIGNPITVEYTVGDLTYIQRSNEGKTYKLVSLDDLRAVAPEGKKFIGWTDGTDTYPVGTVFVLSEKREMKFSAIFEDIPAVMITFKDGTSTLKVVNVTELSESTIPTVSKVGYNFDGWFHDGAKVDPLTYTFTESVTLEAKWTAINCYVTFVAGADYSKTVPVLYGSTVQAPVVPSGYTGWDFDFAQAITEDVTIEAIAAPAPEPSGFDDPVFLTMVMVGVVIVLALLAAFIYAIKEGKIVIGRGPNSKNGKGGVE